MTRAQFEAACRLHAQPGTSANRCAWLIRSLHRRSGSWLACAGYTELRSLIRLATGDAIALVSAIEKPQEHGMIELVTAKCEEQAALR